LITENKSGSNNESITKSMASSKNKQNTIINNQKPQPKKKNFINFYANNYITPNQKQLQRIKNNSTNNNNNNSNSNFTAIPNNYIYFEHKFNQDDFKIFGNGFSIVNESKSKKSHRRNNIITFKECEIQTEYNLTDINKILALNDEYNQQLITYKQEFDELERTYNKRLLEAKTENTREVLTEYIPEMIPPEETYKIFSCIY